jgi:hypothetical protein
MQYYFPNDFQKDVPKTKIDGQYNAVDLIYSDQGLNPYPSTLSDYYNITTCAESASLEGQKNYTWEVPILLPYGIKNILSQDAGTVVTMCQNNGDSDCQWKYRTLVRSYLTKLPGFLFTGFKQLASLNLLGVVSYPTMQRLMGDFNEYYGTEEKYFNLTQTAETNYTYGVPKQKLFIKYAKGISENRRQYIINGMRSLFPSGLSQPIMVDVFALIKSLNTINVVFSFIVGIIGVISLILTFFLLLVATTQNIKDNIWEYGVLRSMGITKA